MIVPWIFLNEINFHNLRDISIIGRNISKSSETESVFTTTQYIDKNIKILNEIRWAPKLLTFSLYSLNLCTQMYHYGLLLIRIPVKWQNLHCIYVCINECMYSMGLHMCISVWMQIKMYLSTCMSNYTFKCMSTCT